MTFERKLSQVLAEALKHDISIHHDASVFTGKVSKPDNRALTTLKFKSPFAIIDIEVDPEQSIEINSDGKAVVCDLKGEQFVFTFQKLRPVTIWDITEFSSTGHLGGTEKPITITMPAIDFCQLVKPLLGYSQYRCFNCGMVTNEGGHPLDIVHHDECEVGLALKATRSHRNHTENVS
jgi:hypothetical protein